MRENQLKLFREFVLRPTLALSLSAATILTLSNCSQEEVVEKEVIRPAKIMSITGMCAEHTRKYPGKVEALDRVEVSFEVSGKLIELAVKAGQKVNKGDLIARLDPEDYQSKYDSAAAQVNQTKAELDRYANLLKEKVVAKSNYDVQKRNYEVAVSNMNIAQKALDNTKLKASFTGRIGATLIDNFQVVQAKQPIVALQKVGSVEIIVNAPEKAMASANQEDKGETFVEFRALPGKRYPLTLKEYSTEADSQTQTYRVVFTLPSPKEMNIFDGMTATVFHVLRDEGACGVDVPVQAVFFDEKGQSFVWLVNPEMGIVKHQVKVGMLHADNLEITSGLAAGDRIVTAGVQNLVEGQKVREFTGTIGE